MQLSLQGFAGRVKSFFLSSLVARPALPAVTVWTNIRVLLIKGMPVDAVRLPGMICERSFSAQTVHPVRDRLEVCRVHATRVAAEVIYLSALWNGANVEFVCYAVRREHPPRRRALTDLPIPQAPPTPSPKPTTIRRRMTVHLRFPAFAKRPMRARLPSVRCNAHIHTFTAPRKKCQGGKRSAPQRTRFFACGGRELRRCASR